VDDLYREQILEHYKRPHNFGRLDPADLEFEDTNPFCGDEQHVFIRLDGDERVAEVAFEGKGCAISTAATSMLTDELTGMSREEVIRLPTCRLGGRGGAWRPGRGRGHLAPALPKRLPGEWRGWWHRPTGRVGSPVGGFLPRRQRLMD
jgi:hypothetical protein